MASYLYNIAKKPPYPLEETTERGKAKRWKWEAWDDFKDETLLDLLSYLHELKKTAGATLSNDFPEVPPDAFSWRELTQRTGICKRYFCEPNDIRTGFGNLVRQRRDGQQVTIDIESAPIEYVPDSRLLTITFTIANMRLESEGMLHKADADPTSGKGFGSVWAAMRGYARCYVYSDGWDGWWNPFAHARWPEEYVKDLKVYSKQRSGATYFVFKMVAPWSLRAI